LVTPPWRISPIEPDMFRCKHLCYVCPIDDQL
jgi:hypothetical protein